MRRTFPHGPLIDEEPLQFHYIVGAKYKKMEKIASPTSTDANPYASLFYDYINVSIEDSLTQVRSVDAALPDEQRVQACHILEYGLQRADAWSLTRELTIDLSPYVERSGAWAEWNQTLVNAVAAAQQAGDVDGEITLRALFARLLQRQGHINETIQQYRKVMRMARASDSRFEEARACSNLGYLFIDVGRFWRSEVLCRHALDIFEEMQSEHGLAHTHNHLGLLYANQREFEKGKYHLDLACHIWQDSKDTHSLFSVYTNLGSLYTEDNQPEKALECLTQALHYARISDEKVWIAKTLIDISHAYLNCDDFIEAERYLLQVREEFADLLHLQDLATVQHNLALIFQYNREWGEANQLLEVAQRSFALAGNKYEEMKVLVALTECGYNKPTIDSSKKYVDRLRELTTEYFDERFYQQYLKYRQDYCDSVLGRMPSKLSQSDM